MSLQRTVLLVTPTASVAQALSSALRRMGHHVLLAKTFEAAKRYLESGPHLLVTELKLGAFNGLHLVLKAGATAIPSIVIADPAFEHDVEAFGAVWLSPEAADGDELQATAIRLLQGVGAAHVAFGEYGEDPTHPSPALPSWGSREPTVRH